MQVKFRMERGHAIRDGSGRYACPNLNCWREHFTGLKPPVVEKTCEILQAVTTCPNCGIEIDWCWVINKL
jgi:hypothetical protein